MAIDMFLKIDTIDGESIDRDHAGEIDVLAYSLGFSNSGDAAAQTGGSLGKAARQNLSMTVYQSKASLPIFLAVATGRMFRDATLTLRKAGASPLEFLELKLEDVLITSQAVGGSGGEDRITESISLDYARITFNYVGLDPRGTPLDTISAGFDFRTNTPI